MEPGFLPLFKCTPCGASNMRRSSGSIVCGECDAVYEDHAGFFNMIDASRGEPTPSSFEQQLMESGVLPYFDFPWAKLATARDRMMYDHVAEVARGLYLVPT